MQDTLNISNKVLTRKNLIYLIKKYKTPLWVYNADIIVKQIKKLKKFDIIRFAQKSCSNIHILKIMKDNNIKIDAVSLGEIKRALIAGFKPHNNDIVFTSDILEKKVLKEVVRKKIPVNAGSIDMLHQLGKISPKHPVWIRINPKFGGGHHIKTNTGGDQSKHGIWNSMQAIPIIEKYNLNLIGLHIHIGSGVNLKNLYQVCESMKNHAIKLNKKIQFISAGGGLSIPYKPTDKEININEYFQKWNSVKKQLTSTLNCPIKLEIEPGRFLVGQSGILIAKVYSVKKTQKNIFVLINAGFNDLMRPVLYGSYHEITVLHKNIKDIQKIPLIRGIIAGPLCESGDIFTVQETGIILPRNIPAVYPGDYIIIHNTGAYGSSMSSNYNSRPFIPEILYEKKVFRLIRRRQTIKEMLSLELPL
ncbi:diaminopimelate decarboxylase [Buchnera aphidicola]|uniref:Diaminopimelate decarboxylase n=1 Tax=Buchnera aphidicola (Cinara cf. splendens/pseudotsugae 3390) TaxID=2518980 RepID=A0A451CXI8_9GAMM|nr:diaminopimelate decarboxylase [Buchnera aphidicola]VFP77856.1 Diaminopimelate decarboxylase [Buchnera aphidicola (Cinara cf. splendens/pseudotsugae 3390)]